VKVTLARIGNSGTPVIAGEMKGLTGIGSEVEIQGNAIVIPPAQDADRPETQERRATPHPKGEPSRFNPTSIG
jgi:antitoxin MazE